MNDETKKVLDWIQSTLEPMAVLEGSYKPDDEVFERLGFSPKGSLTGVEVDPQFIEYLEKQKSNTNELI